MYNEIIQELSSLSKDEIIKIVLSNSKGEVQKATVRPILLKNNRKWQVEKIINNQAFHSNIENNDLAGNVQVMLEEQYFSDINYYIERKNNFLPHIKEKEIVQK